MIAARGLTATARIVHGPDFPIGHHRNGDSQSNVVDASPVGRGAVGIKLGARVNHQLVHPASGQGLCAFHRAGVVVETQAHLGRDRHVRGHRTTHSRGNTGQQFRVLQQRRAAAVAINDLGGAAKVQVDAVRTERGQAGGVLGHANGIGAQQLGPHRHTGRGVSPVSQFGHDAQKSAFGQQGVGDADEFGYATVHAAHAGENVTQDTVQQPLHGCKVNTGRHRNQKQSVEEPDFIIDAGLKAHQP